MSLRLHNKVLSLLIALSFHCGSGSFALAQTRTYSIDTQRSNISFEVKHLGVMTVTGQFEDFSGRLTLENGSLMNMDCRIRTKSINTQDSSRDGTLQSQKYLDAATYPDIEFQYSRATLGSQDEVITGDLKIKDLKRRIRLFVNKSDDKGFFPLILTATVQRDRFGLDFGAMDGLIGNEVKVQVKIYAKPFK